MEYKAFKDLTKEERSEIVEAALRGEAEWINFDGEWQEEQECCVFFDTAYRVKPAKKLDIPWEIIKPEYKWAAMQPNGHIHVYTKQPCFSGKWWCVECSMNEIPDIARVDLLVPVDTTGITCENSLTQRPE